MSLTSKITQKKLTTLFPKGSCFLPKRSLVKAIKTNTNPIAIIGEIRNFAPTYSVPSKYSAEDLVKIYRHYLTAINVFTDDIYFKGSMEWLTLVKQTSNLPVIALDFIVNKEQLCCINSYGADAVILIAELLSANKLRELANFSKQLGLEVIIEVQNEEQVGMALDSSPDIIGINTRSLKDLQQIDLEKPYRLKELIPNNIATMVESGIKYSHDLYRYYGIFDAVMIGSAFVEAENLEAKVKSFVYPQSSDFFPLIWIKPSAYLQNKTAYKLLMKSLGKLGFCVEDKILTNRAAEIAYALYKHDLINRQDGIFGYHVIAAYYDFLLSRMNNGNQSEIIFLKKKGSLVEDLETLDRLKIFFRSKIDIVNFNHRYLKKIFNIKMHSFHTPDANFESYKRDLSILMKYPCLKLSIGEYMKCRMYQQEQWYLDRLGDNR